MERYYTSEKNTQILIKLMKEHGIRKIVASPGATNVCLVGSLQQDPFFEMYSAVDERSAAYMACGLATESGEAVALSCTGATASRNYVPGLTEAFYRKLPILAITSTQHIGRIGNHIPQVIDRSRPMNDLVKMSVEVPTVHDSIDEWACMVSVNKAILELTHRGGGPVHINLTTTYSPDFSVKELPKVNVIKRVEYKDNLPELSANRVGIYVGAHSVWDEELTDIVDKFCELYNGVVFCDHTSNYRGKYRVDPSLVCGQALYVSQLREMDVMIHIGEVSGGTMPMLPQSVWRVNPDGEVRDTFEKLNYVFEMEECIFFQRYVQLKLEESIETSFYDAWNEECNRFIQKIPELPFSNAWIAGKTIDKLPHNCVIYLGILNCLRNWNMYTSPDSVVAYSNTGGFGTDGGVSTLVGASLSDKSKLYFAVVGDLGFFYDMNAMGNRHVGNNVRIMVVNNGRGTEFRNYNHPAARFGDAADSYMAAAGHFGNKSPKLLKHYAEDLGYKYMSASTKDEYISQLDAFVSPDMGEQPIVFEVFTDSELESDALKTLYSIEASYEGRTKQLVRNIVGDTGVQFIKQILKR